MRYRLLRHRLLQTGLLLRSDARLPRRRRSGALIIQGVQNLEGMLVGDVMLRRPKTLPADATVAEARLVLANPSVEVLLLADERNRFSGALSEIPDGAEDDARAVDYAQDAPETLPPSGSALSAFETAARNPQRRVVVLDEAGGLAGLVCLDRSLTRFCGTSRQPPA